MIEESTWHRNKNKQKNFVWTCLDKGIQLYHGKKSPYIIYWDTFQAVYDHAKIISTDNIAIAGTSMDKPPVGSVGHWILNQNNLPISSGKLTPRHLSFLGPIFARMGFIENGYDGNTILWLFNNTNAV